MTARELMKEENEFFDKEIKYIIKLLQGLGGSVELYDPLRFYPQNGIIEISIISTDGNDIYLNTIDRTIKYSIPIEGTDLRTYRYDLGRPSYVFEKIEEYISSTYGSSTDKQRGIDPVLYR